MRGMVRSRSTGTLLVTIVSLIAIGGPALATPAAAADRVELNKAWLQTSGAGMAVALEVRCPSGSDGFLDLRLTQIGESGEVITGGMFTLVACSGASDEILVGLVPFDPETGAYGAPFELGSGFVSATLDVCGPSECRTVTDAETMQIRAGKKDNPIYESPDLTFELPPGGTIEAGGAGAVVTVSYTCAAGVQGFFNASLAQRVDATTVQVAGAGLGLTCTELNRAGVLAFHAIADAWQPSKAFLVVTADVCGPETCVRPSTFRTIRLA